MLDPIILAPLHSTLSPSLSSQSQSQQSEDLIPFNSLPLLSPLPFPPPIPQHPQGLEVSPSQPSKYILYPTLAFAVTMCSSAGAVFTLIGTDVSPFLKASWRLTAQNGIQLLPFALSLKSLIATKPTHEQTSTTTSPTTNSIALKKYIQSLPLLALGGFALGVHFAAWCWSLENTSLSHSLLFVSMHPIILNVGSWLVYFVPCFFLTFVPLKPSVGETVGAVIGLCGGLIMVADVLINSSSSDADSDGDDTKNDPTIEGDAVALLGAFAMAVYLVVGRNVRAWCPIWLYSFPVVFFSMITTTMAAILFDDPPATFSGINSDSVFGFLSAKYIGYAIFLGGGAGVGGHSLINTLLKYLEPVVIGTALLGEPLVGSLIGYILGVSTLPGLFTWIGGGVLVSGLVTVVVSENLKGQDVSKVTDGKDENGDGGCFVEVADEREGGDVILA